MELFGVRLVGFNTDTLAKLFLTAAILAAALVFRALVGATAARRSRRATRRSVWVRKESSLAFGTFAILLLFPISFDRPDRLATFSALLVAGAAVASQKAILSLVGEARHQLERMRQQYPLQPADLEPQSYLRITDNWVELSIRFLVRAWGVRATKDAVTRAILSRYRAEGIAIASATFELVKAPELAIRPVDGRATRPADVNPAQPWDAR